jgi:hypothetical protein
MKLPKFQIGQIAYDSYRKLDIGLITEITIRTQPSYADKTQVVYVIAYKLTGMDNRSKWVEESDLSEV